MRAIGSVLYLSWPPTGPRLPGNSSSLSRRHEGGGGITDKRPLLGVPQGGAPQLGVSDKGSGSEVKNEGSSKTEEILDEVESFSNEGPKETKTGFGFSLFFFK